MNKLTKSLILFFVLIPYLFGQVKASQPGVSQTSFLPLYFSKPRIGIGIAAEFVYADVSLKLVPASTLGNISSNLSLTGKMLQVAPSLEFGSFVCKDYYLAFLVSWRPSALKARTSTPVVSTLSFEHDFRLNHYADIMLKGGYSISSGKMIYGLFGPTIANWELNSQALLTVNNQQRLFNKFRMKKTSIGLGVGLGFECLSQNNYALNVEGTYHFLNNGTSNDYFAYTTVRPFYGNLQRKVNLSFGTLALRITKYFNL